MRLTTLKQTSPERITVVLEDGGEIRSTLSVVTELRLWAGKELSDAQLRELRTLSSRALARDRALGIVSRRLLSCRELHDKLLEKGESEADAAYCVAWLLEHGFLDDARYAAAVVRHYAAKNYGRARLRAELSRRGIERELREDALKEAPEPTDKLDAFLAARLKNPEDPAEIRKLSAALARRGYAWDEIREALRRYADSLYEEST